MKNEQRSLSCSPKKEHQELLKKYAEAVVRVGLNLREGQRLIITNATARGVPPAGRAFVHEVTKAAYAAGARYVEVIWGDEEMLRIRLQNAPANSFDEYSDLADQRVNKHDRKRRCPAFCLCK